LSKPKNQNSLLVLTTLGVYLGLVLLGATPQVLAQAAMTRQFSVKDEVQRKDDLDDNPPPSDNGLEAYITESQAFLDRLRELGVSPDSNGFDYDQVSFIPCEGDRPLLSVTTKHPKPSDPIKKLIDQFAGSLVRGLGFADCVPTIVKDGETKGVNTYLRVALVEKGFIVELNIKKASSVDANVLADQLRTAIPLIDPSRYSTSGIQILKYSNIAYDLNKDSVKVFTALPRAALDPLLAIEAK